MRFFVADALRYCIKERTVKENTHLLLQTKIATTNYDDRAPSANTILF